jgi:hypothetical protein
MLECMLDGRTVMEMPDTPPPASQVARLWDYLSNRLMKTGMVAAQSAAASAAPAAATAAAQPGHSADDAAIPAPAATPAAVEQEGQETIAAIKSSPPVALITAATAPAASQAAQTPADAKMANPEALRRFPRFKYEQAALLFVDDCPVECVVHDISAGGALVIVDCELQVGDLVTLALDSIGKLPAEVRHCEGDRAGLRFIIDPKQQLFLVKHLSAVIAAASTTVTGGEAGLAMR